VVPSGCLVVLKDSFNPFTVMSEHFAYGGHSRIHLNITNWICAEGKKTCKELVFRLQLKAILVQYLLLYKLSFNYDWLTE
jgi:hypothetical protein